MGAVFGDTLARVATNHFEMVDLSTPIASFRDFSSEDWVYDRGNFRLAIGTSNTIILLNQFESLLRSRLKNYSLQALIQDASRSLVNVLNKRSDPYAKFRHYSSKTIRKIRMLERHDSQFVELGCDERSLIRMIPVGLVFHDDLEIVKNIADAMIQITERELTARIAGITLAVGCAVAFRGHSIDEIIDAMIQTSEIYEMKLLSIEDNHRPSIVMRFAREAAIHSLGRKSLLGTKLSERSYSGKWQGKDPSEVLAAVVYCIVRNKGDFKDSLVESVNADGNNELYATIVGAILGTKVGFWKIRKDELICDIELLEKVNLLQSLCNNLYTILSDYPAYTGKSAEQI